MRKRGMPRFRRLSVAATLALGLATLGTGVDAGTALPDVALAGSQGSPAGASLVAPHAPDATMLVTLVLAPRGGGRMERLLTNLQDPTSPQYHRWLKTGDFDRRFAPSSADAAAARAFLDRTGLHPESSPSPFLVRASGTTAQVEAAFSTTIDDYRAASGARFFTNAQAARVPATLARSVIGVFGLADTVRLHPQFTTPASAQGAQGAQGAATPQYGGGPGGSGLTPSQLESVYSARVVHAAANGRGEGTTLAVFELSGYTKADIKAYQQQFFGSAPKVPLTDVYVDGGPITPDCPTGDGCGPFNSSTCNSGCDRADYSGDIEVEADIEVQIAMAPAAAGLLVYNAPNDDDGTTSVDEYFKIANDNLADVVSSSWGLCEPDAGAGRAQAESVVFAQMAAQGQSVFGASGDSGAYDCLGDPNHQAVNVDDPPSQPYMTAVGGTSLGKFNPTTRAHPSYPQGKETVWNPGNACHGTRNGPNGTNCGSAGGGGVSRFWGRPSYQNGTGVISSYNQKGPYCSLAKRGQRCREIPDVSADADPNTAYAIYCTGDKTASNPGASECARHVSGEAVAGWVGVGGTSLSSPLWSAIIDLSVSYHGERFGQANVALYRLFRTSGAYSKYFHDITGANQVAKTNGYYPTTKAYDMATGIGTPFASAIAMATP